MDSELSKKLAVLEALLEELKENNSKSHERLEEHIKSLKQYVNEEISSLQKRTKKIELWKERQSLKLGFLSWLGASIGGGIIFWIFRTLLQVFNFG